MKNPVKIYRLYAKWPGQKRMKAVNWRSGAQVENLIFATIFTEEEKVQVEGELNRGLNPDMNWEFRITQ